MLLLLHESFGIYAFVPNYKHENVQFDQSDIQQTAYLHTCNYKYYRQHFLYTWQTAGE